MSKKPTLAELRAKVAAAMNASGDESPSVVAARKDVFRKQHGDEQDEIKLARTMDKVRARKDKLEEELKLVNAEYDVIRIELIPTLFEDKGLENLKIKNLGRVSLTGDIFCRTSNKTELHDWLRSVGLQDLITEGVNSSTLKAFVKDRMKIGDPLLKPLPPEGSVRVTPYTRASITKA